MDHSDDNTKFNGISRREKRFDGFHTSSAAKATSKSDPMSIGMDFKEWTKCVEKVETLKEKGFLPTSYSIHNALQLVPGEIVDTTDKSAIIAARINNIDPDGFREGKPLRRTIFYMNPYMTCSWCNMMSFVDVMTIRTIMALPEEIALNIPPETLPPCRKCKKADHFVIGPHDFSEAIAARDRLLRERRRKEQKAVRVIQRSYRHYLRRMYGYAGYISRLARKRLEYRAASLINAYARGRLARRQAVVERHLLIIKDAHTLLLQYALRVGSDGRSVFWYKRKDDVAFVFRDYIGFCERTGFIPPRMVVEQNIIEVSRRITARKNYLLTLVQRMWRGLMARRMVKYFRTEVIRLRQLKWSRVLKIQRMFRGHNIRIKIPKIREKRRKEELMTRYLKQTEDRVAQKQREKAHMQTAVAYVKERSEERTARFTTRIDPPTDYEERKMRAFNASIYGDEKVTNRMMAVIGQEQRDDMEFREAVSEENRRKAFIRARIDEHGPRGFGLRGFKPDPAAGVFIGSFRMGPEAESSRSRGMRKYFEAELSALMKKIIDRAVHDHTRRDLLGRFSEYNVARLVGQPNPLAMCGAMVLAGDRSKPSTPNRAMSPYGEASFSASAQSPKKGLSANAGMDAPSMGRLLLDMREPTPPPSAGRRMLVSTTPMNKKKKKFSNQAPRHFQVRAYKYPANINENPRAFLDDEVDYLFHPSNAGK